MQACKAFNSLTSSTAQNAKPDCVQLRDSNDNSVLTYWSHIGDTSWDPLAKTLANALMELHLLLCPSFNTVTEIGN